MTDNLDALKARDDMLAVAAAWPTLRARLTPTSAASEIRTPPGSKPPIDVGVSDLMRTVEDRTRFYAQVLVEEVPPAHGCDGACHGASGHHCAGHLCATDGEPTVLPERCPTRLDPVTTSTMPGLLQEVAARYGHFTHRSGERMALDFLDDAHEMRRMVAGMLAQTEPARWAGPCPTAECTGELYLRADQSDMRCRMCCQDHTLTAWREHLDHAFHQRLMTRSEIISALHVMGRTTKPDTVHKWVQRGRLVKVVEDPDLYQFTQAMDLAERAASRGSGRIAA